MADIGPGDLVVCICGGPFGEYAELIENARYRVRGIYEVAEDVFNGTIGPALLLYGVYNSLDENGVEPGYCLSLFRPLNDGDAEIFRQIVRKPKKVLA